MTTSKNHETQEELQSREYSESIAQEVLQEYKKKTNIGNRGHVKMSEKEKREEVFEIFKKVNEYRGALEIIREDYLKKSSAFRRAINRLLSRVRYFSK